MMHGNNMYSASAHNDPVLFKTEYDGQEYVIEIKFAKIVNEDPLEWSAFQSIVFK